MPASARAGPRSAPAMPISPPSGGRSGGVEQDRLACGERQAGKAALRRDGEGRNAAPGRRRLGRARTGQAQAGGWRVRSAARSSRRTRGRRGPRRGSPRGRRSGGAGERREIDFAAARLAACLRPSASASPASRSRVTARSSRLRGSGRHSRPPRGSRAPAAPERSGLRRRDRPSIRPDPSGRSARRGGRWRRRGSRCRDCLDDEARPVRLEPHRDGAASGRAAVAYVAGAQGQARSCRRAPPSGVRQGAVRRCRCRWRNLRLQPPAVPPIAGGYRRRCR